MKRREFIAGLGGAAAWPLAARAQQPVRLKRIGYVGGHVEDTYGKSIFAAFRDGLVDRGWIVGRNIEIVARYGSADPERNQAYVAEMLTLRLDVIVSGNTDTTAALVKETRTIPIVMPQSDDPVAMGLVASIAHPGGNLTGFSNAEPAIATKWLQLLKEAVPTVTRVAVLVDTAQQTRDTVYVRVVEPAAQSLGIPLTWARVSDAADIEQTLASFSRAPNGGLIVIPGPELSNKSALIVESTVRHRLPAIYPTRNFVEDGGLICYAPDVLDQYRRSGDYVDRILKGANPGDLPIQFPTKYELVVNLKAAKVIGLTLPASFLLRADRVIE
jgi:putative ABC transport system substrate-binding protein